jgi:hypothetical protein
MHAQHTPELVRAHTHTHTCSFRLFAEPPLLDEEGGLQVCVCVLVCGCGSARWWARLGLLRRPTLAARQARAMPRCLMAAV